MKNRLIKIFLLLVASAWLTSCLKTGLDNLPLNSAATITGFSFEHRWVWADGRAGVQLLSVTTTISNDSVKVSITIPSPNAATFPETERAKVSLNNIVATATISPAAIIEPLEGAPRLGVPGNFSKNTYKYRVTAADGSSKIWTLVIAPLPLINQWEGTYIETGNLEHSANGIQNPPANFNSYLTTSGVNQVKATAGYWYFSNTSLTYFISVNPNNSVTITADPGAAVVVQQEPSQTSTYDPATKKFDLYYFYYSGGNPANWRKFHTILTRK